MDVDMNEEAEGVSRKIQVRFVTKLKPPLKVPTTVISIPANLTRFGLSSVINSLLEATGDPDYKPEPFDILIDGELVRMSLEEFLVVKGISVEKILDIEYTRVVAPRKEEDPSLHDDWVSAVDGSSSRFFFTGCYDGLGRVWEGAGLCTHILEGHTAAVTSVSIIDHKGAGTCTLATASNDRTIRLWKLNLDEAMEHPMKISAFKTLCGHKDTVKSVAAQTSGEMICSGSWDSTIKLWQTHFDAEVDVSIKKRKVKDEVEESQLEGEAASTLVGHTEHVSSVVWPQRDTIYSASWDHSVRKWDIETGKDSLNIFCGKALNCLDVGGDGSALIIAGGSDPVLRIWDPRKPGTSAPVFQFASHTSWISACKWHDNSWFHLLSSSYDGKVMLWDLRTAWPLSVIESHSDKVLCADWWRSNSVISGGADSKVCISSEISVQ